MKNRKLEINQMTLNNNELSVTVSCKVKYNPDVFEPKLKILFSNDKEEILLPVKLLKRDFLSSEMMESMRFAYEYDINNVFIEINDNPIKINFYLIYGNEIIDQFKLEVNEGLLSSKNSSYNIKYDNDVFYLEKIESINSSGSLYYISNFVSIVYRMFLFLVSIPLIPIFILDAIFIALRIPNLSSYRENTYLEDRNRLKRALRHILWRISTFTNIPFEENGVKLKNYLIDLSYQIIKKFFKKENQVMFISERDLKLTGNLKFIYEKIKDDDDLNIAISLCNCSFPLAKWKHRIKTYIQMAKSEVILLDAYFKPIHRFGLNDQYLVQTWHACGAFKTFGFSRLGREGGPGLGNTANRKYDYAIVSSKEVADCYAEGFGISKEKVIATGVPRTDIFFDENYKAKVVNQFFEDYPQLKDKKIMLFAPTYRGTNRVNGHYPLDAFDPVEVYKQLGEEYAIIIKHHFFVTEHSEIPEEYRENIIDMPITADINDMLFVADLMVTDYSSVVFEASLLDIPMLLYAFDLDQYISDRSFYYEFKDFVPGKIVYTQEELIQSILAKDFDEEKLENFKKKFFDYTDGKSTERVIELVYNLLKK